MYIEHKQVVEDAVVGKGNPRVRNLYTGGENKLVLPVTVSFLDKGEYTVKVNSGEITVELVKSYEEEKDEAKGETIYYVDCFTNELTTKKDEIAPPERYYEYRRGVHEDLVTEKYLICDRPEMYIDFSYSTDDIMIPTARKNHFEKHGVGDKMKTAILVAYTVPPITYEAVVKQFTEMQEDKEQ